MGFSPIGPGRLTVDSIGRYYLPGLEGKAMSQRHEAWRSAAVSTHAVTIICEPVSEQFEAVCACCWRHKGPDVIEAVKSHWRGEEQTFGSEV